MSEVIPRTFFLDYGRENTREGAGLAMTSARVRQGDKIMIVAKRERFARIREQLIVRLQDLTLLEELADRMEWGNGAVVVLCDPQEPMEHEREEPQQPTMIDEVIDEQAQLSYVRLHKGCPFCGAPREHFFMLGIPERRVLEEGEFMVQALACEKCRKGWHDWYRLSHIERMPDAIDEKSSASGSDGQL